MFFSYPIISCILFSCLASASFICNATDYKARIFVLTDISNEPDDQESLVRLLLHADQYMVEGLVATTSYWLNDTTYPEVVLDVIDAYANVTTNLRPHSKGSFPSAQYLRSKVATSHHVYGLAALHNATLSGGAELLISAVDASTEPLYVQLWGGATVLAEALNHVQQTRSAAALNIFSNRIRVYAISDQDNAGIWIRQQFPKIQYIASVHGFNMYGRATWTGMSGELFYYFDAGGSDTSLVSHEYIKKNFQRGSLGAKYPDFAFIMEGDSPSLLYTMQNGLNFPERPEYGNWGGRYTLVDLSGNSRHYSDAVDWVTAANNVTYISNQATIWRWRSAYQNEMAARVQWSVSGNYSAAVHPPDAVVNGSCGHAPIELAVQAGTEVILDATQSSNPDTNGTDGLKFDWMHYREVTLIDAPNWVVGAFVPLLDLTCLDDACMRISTVMPNATVACEDNVAQGCQSYHVILSVTNGGTTPMTRYKRVIFNVAESVFEQN